MIDCFLQNSTKSKSSGGNDKNTDRRKTNKKQLLTRGGPHQFLTPSGLSESQEKLWCGHGSELEEHSSQAVQLDEKYTQCRYCDRTFDNLSGLHSHVKTHIGNLYQCVMCFRAFTDRTQADKHRVRDAVWDCLSVHNYSVLEDADTSQGNCMFETNAQMPGPSSSCEPVHVKEVHEPVCVKDNVEESALVKEEVPEQIFGDMQDSVHVKEEIYDPFCVKEEISEEFEELCTQQAEFETVFVKEEPSETEFETVFIKEESPKTEFETVFIKQELSDEEYL